MIAGPCLLCGRNGQRGFVAAFVVSLPIYGQPSRRETVIICRSREACRRRQGMRP